MEERGSVIDPDDVWYMADAIPTGTSAGIALLEHRWAIPLRDAIERAGGKTLVDSWVHPQDLVAAGAEASRKSSAFRNFIREGVAAVDAVLWRHGFGVCLFNA